MNLTKTSKTVRLGIIFGGVLFLSYYLVVFFIIPSGKALIKAAFPDRTPPNPVYGMMDQLEFIEKPVNMTNPKYSLNTKNGKLPEDLPRLMKVYKSAIPKFSYLAGKKAIADALYFGFIDADLTSGLKGSTYKWRNLKTGAILEINTDTLELALNSNINQLPTTSLNAGVTEESAIQNAESLFKTLARYDQTYASGQKKVTLGTYYGGYFVQPISANDAQIAMVDLYRKFGDYDVVTQDPNKGLLHTILLEGSRGLPNMENFPIVETHYREVVTPSNATYPVIPVAKAWEAVQAGKGVIAGITSKSTSPFQDYVAVRVDTVLVDNVKLAYYETAKFQSYLQPIYVFEGIYTTRGSNEGRITVYFPAITADYVKK